MSDETTIQFNCPICGKPLQKPANMVGKKTRCPRCGEPFVVPPGKPGGGGAPTTK